MVREGNEGGLEFIGRDECERENSQFLFVIVGVLGKENRRKK